MFMLKKDPYFVPDFNIHYQIPHDTIRSSVPGSL